jgi:hypothetical protein
VPNDCWYAVHSIGFADAFYNAYRQRYGSPPPVNEWRFHDFGLRYVQGDMNGWWGRIDQLASWSVAHGANMVLGAWGFHGWREGPGPYQEHLKQAMGRILNDPRINGAVYWSYESWAGELHYLANSDGSLTPEGVTYANPLTDAPNSIVVYETPASGAKAMWYNPTAAWGVEVEYWVQNPGTESFTLNKTERIGGPGAAEASLTVFRNGTVVKTRARYYNVYAQGGWSNFSAPVTISRSPKSPLPCFVSKRIQSEPCS